MTGDEEFFIADLIGKRLLRVTAAWHHDGADEPSLLHLWLHLEGLGPVLFHTPGTGLSLRVDRPRELYSMEPHGQVTLADDSPDVPLTRFVGQAIRSVREIHHRDARADFVAGLTLQFPGGSVRLLALDDELVLAHDRYLGPVEAQLHEDVILARVVLTCHACPSQWDAWTTGGQYLYLRYRHGEGSVEQQPSDDPDTWDGEGSRLWTEWHDGTGGGRIELADFLALAGLRLAPDAELSSRYEE
ncbi:hypothetical protein OG455_00840 [Kitasatospora sp. NBC_01287]|uniref:hypothetical protein n=1 Tax=Kitasatospora sp. NBC_01287 TaxID=2903573 RepID=UPI00225BB5F9|nr:hypothetical protein [Kitasatospora sp. NBC_01287]MCX4744071.1 hypothetical protein [Kitasatospora sp. NBC_01287]